MPPHPSVHGLSSEEAARRLARDGANRLPSG
ncbi:cation-transporting P-type ATPase, partial [Rhizobium brockwellii]